MCIKPSIVFYFHIRYDKITIQECESLKLKDETRYTTGVNVRRQYPTDSRFRRYITIECKNILRRTNEINTVETNN